MILQKFHESKGKPLPILLVDVQACFDKMVLDDVVFDTIEAGADLKATRVLRKFSDRTVIKLRGDQRNGGEGEGREIRGTLGQGSNFAPPGIGLTTSKSIMSKFSQGGRRDIGPPELCGRHIHDAQGPEESQRSMREDRESFRRNPTQTRRR